MSEEYNPVIVGTIVPFQLSDSQKNRFLYLVGESKESANFLKAISFAIGEAKLEEAERIKCKPANVRKNLDCAIKYSRKLLESLKNLDPLSMQMLRDENLCDVKIRLMWLNEINKMNSFLVKTREKAEKLPKNRSGIYETHKRVLAFGVAAAVSETLGVQPSLTHNIPSGHEHGKKPADLYAQCLALCIEICGFTQKEEKGSESLYALMKDGLEMLKSRKKAGGLVEYQMPPKK